MKGIAIPFNAPRQQTERMRPIPKWKALIILAGPLLTSHMTLLTTVIRVQIIRIISFDSMV
jgi:hypothetical protein